MIRKSTYEAAKEADPLVTGLDPEGLGGGAGGIDCRRHVSSGVSRERGRV